METVTLKPLLHRGTDCIGIYFSKNDLIQSLLRLTPSARWSRTHQCWYIENKNFTILKKNLHGKVLLQTLEQKSGVSNNIAIYGDQASKQSSIPATKEASFEPGAISNISPQNGQALEVFRQQLVLKGYSASTIKTYCNEFRHFLSILKNKPANSFTIPRLKDYFEYCYSKLHQSENTLHSKMNALKFYYEQVLGFEKFFWEIPRPKKQHQLPKIFNQEEIAAIINSVENIKHKVMLMLAYSGGLRVSEVVAIKTYHIDSKKMTVFISQAKGKKDRMVTLSLVLLIMLREYALTYKPAREGYLFEGSVPGMPYSTRSLQQVLQSAKKKAGIMKPGSIHSLRHSFATHLIEKGTDVTMIQKLLGHNDLKTTLIYLHTSNKDLLKIVSPLDDLKLS